jgi:hypothetical protein
MCTVAVFSADSVSVGLRPVVVDRVEREVDVDARLIGSRYQRLIQSNQGQAT